MKSAVKFCFYQLEDLVHLREISVSTSAFTYVTYLQSFFKLSMALFHITAECTGNVRLQFGRRPESDLVQLKKLSIKIKVAKGHLKLKNLFNGDRVLGM